MERTVFLDNIRYNAGVIKQKSGVALCAVVKCNAYGHGVSRVCKALNGMVECFAVSSILEAKAIRAVDSDTPILNLGTFKHSQISVLQNYNIIQSVHNIPDLIAISEFITKHNSDIIATNNNITIDIKINSGFNRLGLNIQECQKALNILENSPNVVLHGLYTHLCDYTSPRYSQIQLENFETSSKLFLKYSPLLHCVSSKGIEWGADFKCDMARCGLALYGIGHKDLKQAMHIHSHIVQTNLVPRGMRVGYNNYTMSRDSIIATITGGYGQGILRGVYDRVLVADTLCPIVGDICMDFFMIDVSQIARQKPNLELVGHEVIITDDKLNLESIAQNAKTIPYQLLVATNVKNNKIVYK